LLGETLAPEEDGLPIDLQFRSDRRIRTALAKPFS
jgi:hypothetical protein